MTAKGDADVKMKSKEAFKIYENIKKNYLELGGSISIDVFQARSILTDLVERDTPKKVVKIQFENSELNECPNCNRTIFDDEYITHKPDYCKRCGQRLDWNVENE